MINMNHSFCSPYQSIAILRIINGAGLMSMLFAAINNNPYLFYSSLFIIGLIVGSFLNVIIYRLPIMLHTQWRAESHSILYPETKKTTESVYNLAFPRSQCPKCHHKIRAIHNIPIVSYLVLKGACAYCQASISKRYPLIELASAIISVSIAWRYGVTLDTFIDCFFAWSLIALAMIDLDTQLLPDDITLPLLWFGLIFNSLATSTASLYDAVWGAIAGYCILWGLCALFKLITGKQGMGHGDFKLLAALGAWFGWTMLPLIILISSLLGSLVGGILIALKRHQRSQPLPFGPYLAIAGLVCLFWGKSLFTFYLNGMSL